MAKKQKLDPRKLPTMAPEEPPAPEPPLDAEIRPRRSDEPPEAQPEGPGALITREVLKEVARVPANAAGRAVDPGAAPLQYESVRGSHAADRRKKPGRGKARSRDTR